MTRSASKWMRGWILVAAVSGARQLTHLLAKLAVWGVGAAALMCMLGSFKP